MSHQISYLLLQTTTFLTPKQIINYPWMTLQVSCACKKLKKVSKINKTQWNLLRTRASVFAARDNGHYDTIRLCRKKKNNDHRYLTLARNIYWVVSCYSIPTERIYVIYNLIGRPKTYVYVDCDIQRRSTQRFFYIRLMQVGALPPVSEVVKMLVWWQWNK